MNAPRYSGGMPSRSPRPPADPKASAPTPLDDLSDAILALARRYQLRDRDRVCRHGVTVSQCYALEAIVAADGLRVTELARALGLDKSTASRVAESLCAAGLARYGDETGNRRAKRVLATRKGRAIAERIHQEIRDEHRRAFEPFDAAAIETCAAMIRALGAK